MKDWSKKRYWIVGASEGLGLALAEKMSEAGASLILTARNEARLKEIASTLPNKVEVLPLDITDLNAVRKSVKKIGKCRWICFPCRYILAYASPALGY